MGGTYRFRRRELRRLLLALPAVLLLLLSSADADTDQHDDLPRRAGGRVLQGMLEETPDSRLNRMVTEAQSRVGSEAEGLTPEERKEDAFLNAFIHNIPKKKKPGKKDPKAKGKSDGAAPAPPTEPSKEPSKDPPKELPKEASKEPSKEPPKASKKDPKENPKTGGMQKDLLSLFGAGLQAALGKPDGGGGGGGVADPEDMEMPGDGAAKGLGPIETPQKREARLQKSLAPLRKFPKLNISDPWVGKFSLIADDYLAPWRPVEGATDGLGKGRGIISPRILKSISMNPGLFYRFGGFLGHWYRNRRFIFTVRTIQLAIEKYELSSLTAELFVNTCDEPISLDSAVGDLRAGYPVFSHEYRPGSIDILYPDPLDLSKGYMSHSPKTMPWGKRKSVAVFRGATTNYMIRNDSNWRVSPRIRLHKMSEIRPDLLDARLTRWSHVLRAYTPLLEHDGLHLDKPVDRDALEAYKYELVVDGGGGSSRTCGVMASNRAMLKQDSTYSQFFQRLLKPYVHYVPVKHFWEDLYDQVEWAQQNDEVMKGMPLRANKVASHVCTWEGRALYWAVLLVKYNRQAMELPATVKPPANTCSFEFPVRLMRHVKGQKAKLPRGWPPVCRKPDIEDVEQPPCTFFCVDGAISVTRQQWLAAETLSHITFDD